MDRLLLVGIATLALASGCATFVRSTDFRVSSNHVQHVAPPGSKRITVRCQCPVRAAIESAAVDDIQLHVVGTYSSVGYHGAQKVPKVVPPALLEFNVAAEKGETIVQGREFRHIHHEFFFNSVDVYYPHGFTVTFETVAGADGAHRIE